MCIAPVQLQTSQVMPHAESPTGCMLLGLAVWLQVEAGDMKPASCRQLMQLACAGEHHRWRMELADPQTYGKPCDALQQGVKLEGLLRDRA